MDRGLAPVDAEGAPATLREPDGVDAGAAAEVERRARLEIFELGGEESVGAAVAAGAGLPVGVPVGCCPLVVGRGEVGHV